jgi:hypothetical protein
VSLNDYTAVAMVWHTAPFTTAADLFARELVVGASAPASDTTVRPQLLNALIGTRTKVVKGYPGTAGVALAMERGEVQGMIGDDWASIKANKADWLRDRKVRILPRPRGIRTCRRFRGSASSPPTTTGGGCSTCSWHGSNTAARSWRRRARRHR